MRRHRDDVAVLHIHQHEGVHFFPVERLFHRGLNFGIDGQPQVAPISRRLRYRRGTGIAIRRGGNHEAAFLPDEVLVELVLEAGSAPVAVVDDVAAEILALVALLVARQVAKHVGKLRVARIDAPRHADKAKALRFQPRRADEIRLRRRDVFQHREGLVTLGPVLGEQVRVADGQRDADRLVRFIEPRAHPRDDVGIGRRFARRGPFHHEILLVVHRRVDAAVGGKDIAAQGGHLVLGQRRDDVGALVRGYAQHLVGREAGLVGVVEHRGQPVGPLLGRLDLLWRTRRAARRVDLVLLQVDENVAGRGSQPGQPAQRAGRAVDLHFAQRRRFREGRAGGDARHRLPHDIAPKRHRRAHRDLLRSDGPRIVIAHPNARQQLRRITHEPSVAITFGIAGHAGDG